MSLYFSLFETISLFVSAFIVNFLVLDGRSNYLEGALLCAAYVIIAYVILTYPKLTSTDKYDIQIGGVLLPKFRGAEHHRRVAARREDDDEDVVMVGETAGHDYARFGE